MAALAADRNTPRATPGIRRIPVAASVTIYVGALVAVDTSGYARPARVSTTDKVVGRAMARVTNGAVAGAVSVDVQSDEVAYYGNSAAGDAITAADIGSDCYVVDDQTVAKTNGTNTRCRAGKIYNVTTAEGVGVRFDQ